MHCLPAVGVSLLAFALQAQVVRAPEPLAIYYGYPSLVNGATSNAQAAQVFAAYARVVLGDGLEDPTHPDHANTAAIVALAPATRFFGYITLGDVGGAGLTRAQIQLRIAQWKATGAAGIFLDEAGYEYQVTRQRQRDVLADVHAQGLAAFVNAWVPSDLFDAQVHPQNPGGLPTGMTAQDRYLLESFQVMNGGYENVAEFVQRADATFAYATALGTQVDAVTTTLAGQPFDQGKLDYAWWSTALYGFAGFGWGEPIFSALTLQLPFRPRPNATALTGAWSAGVVHAASLPLHQRVADSGHLRLDTNAHVGAFVPATLGGPVVAPLGIASSYVLHAPTSGGLVYATVATEATTPGVPWVDGRVVPIVPGPLFALSLTPSAVFVGFGGTLDATGMATSTLVPPNLPVLVGYPFALVGLVLDAATPELLRVFTAPLAVRFG